MRASTPWVDEDEGDMPLGAGARGWQTDGARFWVANKTFPRLGPGCYEPEHAQNIGVTLRPRVVDNDGMVDLPGSAALDVVAEIEAFWKLRPKFEARGLVFKRGVLLHGPSGAGKSSTINQLVGMVTRNGGICVYVGHPRLAAAALQMARAQEPNLPIVAVLEDIDSLIEHYDEHSFLALLDGEHHVDNIVFVATTNYFDKLAPRLANRPSRFDIVRVIGMPTAEARRHYLRVKEPSLEGVELNQWIERSEGYSIAHLKELLVMCRCYGLPLADATARLDAMMGKKPEPTLDPVKLDEAA